MLRSKQQPDGTWLRESTHPGAVHLSMEDGDGQPSRWNMHLRWRTTLGRAAPYSLRVVSTSGSVAFWRLVRWARMRHTASASRTTASTARAAPRPTVLSMVL